MILDKNNPFIDLKYWWKSLDTNSLDPTNQNLIKVPIVFEQTNKITRV